MHIGKRISFNRKKYFGYVCLIRRIRKGWQEAASDHKVIRDGKVIWIMEE